MHLSFTFRFIRRRIFFVSVISWKHFRIVSNEYESITHNLFGSWVTTSFILRRSQRAMVDMAVQNLIIFTRIDCDQLVSHPKSHTHSTPLECKIIEFTRWQNVLRDCCQFVDSFRFCVLLNTDALVHAWFPIPIVDFHEHSRWPKWCHVHGTPVLHRCTQYAFNQNAIQR